MPTAQGTTRVIGLTGKRISSQVIETNGESLVTAVGVFPGTRHIIFEEGNLAAWMYELLDPLAHETVVVRVSKKSHEKKSYEIDAFGLAESLRIKSFENRVDRKQSKVVSDRQKRSSQDFPVGSSMKTRRTQRKARPSNHS